MDSPNKVKIRILDQAGENEEIAELSFGGSEWEILHDFSRYSSDLAKNPLVIQGIPSSFNLNWAEGEGLRVTAEVPPDEQIDAMLVRLRPFLLEGESTFFPKVKNFVARAAANQRIKQHLDTLQRLYSGRRLQSIFVAGASSPQYPEPTIINSEEMLNLWLNGHRFHKDKDKQAHFDALHALSPPDASVALLLFLIADKVRAILALQRLVLVLQGEPGTVLAEVILEEPIQYLAYLHASLAQVSAFERDGSNPLPTEGEQFERVLDLTQLGPAHFHQLLDPLGRVWMQGGISRELGEHHCFLRVGKGFRLGDGSVSENGMDLIATLKVVAFLVEDPSSHARRNPAKAVLQKMSPRSGAPTPSRTVLKAIATKEELERFLERDPKPMVDWAVVPRVAFEFAYWPISDQARRRVKQIWAEGRQPTFDEVEGRNILQAWEPFAGESEGLPPEWPS